MFEEVFAIIDQDNSGYIKSKQFKKFLRNLGLNISQIHVDQMYISLGFKGKLNFNLSGW